MSELFEVLGHDYDRCREVLASQVVMGEIQPDGTKLVDSNFASRQLIRASFAYIEGATFGMKVQAPFDAEQHSVELTPQEAHFIYEVDFRLSDNGDIRQCDLRIPLAQNVRFAFRITEKANRLTRIFDPKASWWSDFRKSIKVRNRLTHPRWPEDLDVSAAETVTLVRAVEGFQSTVISLLEARHEGTKGEA